MDEEIKVPRKVYIIIKVGSKCPSTNVYKITAVEERDGKKLLMSGKQAICYINDLGLVYKGETHKLPYAALCTDSKNIADKTFMDWKINGIPANNESGTTNEV